MYALLDFGDLRIEQRTEFSQVKTYCDGKVVDSFKQYFHDDNIQRINNFFKGIVERNAFWRCIGHISIEEPINFARKGLAMVKCANLINVTIPSGVISIGASAFEECICLTNVEIPSGVTDIGEMAFLDCELLANITIPQGVSNIGNMAFCGCRALTSIEIPDSVRGIGNHAFDNCQKQITWKGTTYTDPLKFNDELLHAGIAKNDVWW